jgi:hypothetical protein
LSTFHTCTSVVEVTRTGAPSCIPGENWQVLIDASVAASRLSCPLDSVRRMPTTLPVTETSNLTFTVP